ncbi:MAG: sigma 54-interacting transcriptional regulator, partial [Polyangiaceae bacterium]
MLPHFATNRAVRKSTDECQKDWVDHSPSMGHAVTTVPIQASQLLPLVIDLSVALGADDRYQKLLDALRRLFAIDGAVLLECRGDRLFPIARSGVSAKVLGLSFPLSYQPVAGNVVSKTPHRHVGDVALIERPAPQPGEEAADGVLVSLPLFFEDTLVGALNLGGIDPHAFDDIDDDTLMLCGALAGAALRSANLFHRTENLAARLKRINQDLQSHVREQLSGVLLGDSRAVVAMRQAIVAWAQESGPLLLSGHAGSGHESVAHAIHAQGPRHEQAFVYVNGSRYREPDTADTLLSTEHPEDQLSQLQLASGGTLYIEAVDHIAQATQRRLATIIAAYDDQREQEPVTADTPRIILSVRESLESPKLSLAPQLLEAIRERGFRLPALAQRKDDIPLLAQHYAAFHSQR